MEQEINATGEIRIDGDCAYYRPAGKVTLDEAVDLVDRAVVFAQAHHVPKLLVNAVNLTGFPSPSLPERYFAARRFAESSKAQVQLAMVIRAEMIDPEKFGVIVARNAGMNADVFPTETEALEWLLKPRFT
jgi:hypothetical protein